MTMIWKTQPTAEILSTFRSSMSKHLDINVVDVGDDLLRMSMPVNTKTTQPMGFLHGGASCVLAESVASSAAWLCIDSSKEIVLGLEINANHVKTVREGLIYGTAKPIHLGKSTSVWDVRITQDMNEELICISRVTLAVKPLRND